MKKIVALLLLSFSVQAGVTLDWEIDLNDNFPNLISAGNSFKLSNGDYRLYCQVSTNISGGFNVIIDKNDGSYKFISEYEPTEGFINNLTDGAFILHNWYTDKFKIYYLDENNSYQSMEVDGPSAFENSSGKDTPLGNFFYVQLSSILRKYTITSDNPTPTLSAQTSSGFNQDNYVINWDSSSGAQYQIQSSTDLTNWVDVGSALIGTGDMMTWANHVTNSQAFYRVVEE